MLSKSFSFLPSYSFNNNLLALAWHQVKAIARAIATMCKTCRSKLFKSGYKNCPCTPDPDEFWIVDSGAQNHFVRNKKLLKNAVPCLKKVNCVNLWGKKQEVTHYGDGYLPNPKTEIQLSNVSCVPNRVSNLLSVSRLTADNQLSLTFYGYAYVAKNSKTKEIVTFGKRWNGTYIWPTAFASKPKPKGRMNELCELVRGYFDDLVLSRLCDIRDKLRVHCYRTARWIYHQHWARLYDVEAAAYAHNHTEDKDLWTVDTGAWYHVTCHKDWLHNLRPLPSEFLPSTHAGEIYLPGRNRYIVLRNVRFMPGVNTNLVSVATLVADGASGYRMEFTEHGFTLQSDRGNIVAVGRQHKSLYFWSDNQWDPMNEKILMG